MFVFFAAVIRYVSETVLRPCANQRVELITRTRGAAAVAMPEHLVVTPQNALYRGTQHNTAVILEPSELRSMRLR